jgi:hypothetical protein
MWKSGILLRAATNFYPQPDVKFSTLFNRPCEEKFSFDFSTVYFSTFHRGCGKNEKCRIMNEE